VGLFDRAVYVASAHDLEQLPPDVGAEVAFVGRSNAGKSIRWPTIDAWLMSQKRLDAHSSSIFFHSGTIVPWSTFRATDMRRCPRE
jgi:hypothetical protein